MNTQISTEPQICFVNSEGFMLCNYIMRAGVPTYTKSGKWWAWFVGFKNMKPKQETAPVKTDTAS